MIRLSLYIITYNEEERLPRTLEAAHKIADEIVVVDCGSTDGTKEIAERYGARFYFNKWVSFGDQVRVAEQYCSNEWVLRLDADEELSPGLAEEIARIKEDPDCDGYYLRIGDVYPGVENPIRWVKHYKLIRLYDRRKMAMLGVLDHDAVDFLVPEPKVRTLHNFVKHHSFLSMSHQIEKQNRASDTLVAMTLKGGKHYSPWRMLGPTTLSFLRTYIMHRHFLYGWWGFVNAVTLAFFRFVKFAKCYEYEQKKKTS